MPSESAVDTGGDVALGDVVAARRNVHAALAASPTVQHPLLSEAVGVTTSVKLENTLPTGAFKARGAVELVSRLRGTHVTDIVAPTRGNHGQALAWAAGREDLGCHLFVPHGNNPDKNAAMRALGARVHEVGASFDEASDAALRFARTPGVTFVHPGETAALIAGIGTSALELIEQVDAPLDAVYVPVGVGSCASAFGLVFRQLSPRTKIIGVAAARAPALARAWRGEPVREVPPGRSLADGLAVGRPPTLTLRLLRTVADEMLMVDEAQIADAIALYASTLHQLAEGAAAAALAGARVHAKTAGFRHVAVILTGGNIEAAALHAIMSRNVRSA